MNRRFDVLQKALEGFQLSVLVNELRGHIAAHAVRLEGGEYAVVRA